MSRAVARSGVFFSLAAAASVTLLAWIAPARADDMARNAEHFIAELAERANTLLSDEASTPAERRDRFRNMFRESFDVPEVARFVLGRYWRRAKPEEREEYLQLFEALVVGTWAPRFAVYQRERFEIVGAHAADGANLARVSSAFSFPDSDPMRIDWWVKGRASTYRIVDIVVEGVSMRVTHRSEFASVIRTHGGRLEGLLEALRKKTAQLNTDPQ